jgi:hypothetical protein
MNLKTEASAYSTDHLDELASEIKDELDDEILEIADANVRRKMSMMRMRKRQTISGGDKDAIDEVDEQSRSVSVANFSVKRNSAVSLHHEEMQILEKLLAKRTENVEEVSPTKPALKKPKKISVRHTRH